MIKKRKQRKYIKFLKNDIAKAWNIPKKVLFGKNAPVSNVSIALDAIRKIESERVKKAQETIIIEMIKDQINEKYKE